jgi:hypothetical protein
MVASGKAVPPDRSSQGSPHVVSRFKEPAEAVFVVSRVLPLIRSRHIEQIIFSFRFSLSSQTRIDALARQGNVYQITSDSGDSVRATVNPTWIDVAVGLGRWPSSVHGLIANPNGNINQIESRDGIVLANPFSFNDLYHRFADSWRVSDDAPCCRFATQRGLLRLAFPSGPSMPKTSSRTSARRHRQSAQRRA